MATGLLGQIGQTVILVVDQWEPRIVPATASRLKMVEMPFVQTPTAGLRLDIVAMMCAPKVTGKCYLSRIKHHFHITMSF